jgi:hypothetical protein
MTITVYNRESPLIEKAFDRANMRPIEPNITPAPTPFYSAANYFPTAFKDVCPLQNPGEQNIATITGAMLSWASMNSTATPIASRRTACATALNTWSPEMYKTAAFALCNPQFNNKTDIINNYKTLLDIFLNVDFTSLSTALEHILLGLRMMAKNCGADLFAPTIAALAGLASPLSDAMANHITAVLDVVLQHKIKNDALTAAATASKEPTFISPTFDLTGITPATNAAQTKKIFGKALIHAMNDGVTFQQFVTGSFNRNKDADAFASEKDVQTFLDGRTPYYPVVQQTTTTTTTTTTNTTSTGPSPAHEARLALIKLKSGLTDREIAEEIISTTSIAPRIPTCSGSGEYAYSQIVPTDKAMEMTKTDYVQWASNSEMRKIQVRDFWRYFSNAANDSNAQALLVGIYEDDSAALTKKTNLGGADDASSPPLYYGLTTAKSDFDTANTALEQARTALAAAKAVATPVPADVTAAQTAYTNALKAFNIAKAHAEEVAEAFNMAELQSNNTKWPYMVSADFNFKSVKDINETALNQAIKTIFRLELALLDADHATLLTNLTPPGAAKSYFEMLIDKLMTDVLANCVTAFNLVLQELDATDFDAERQLALQMKLDPSGSVTVAPTQMTFDPTVENIDLFIAKAVEKGTPILTAYSRLFSIITGNYTSTGLSQRRKDALTQAISTMLSIPNDGVGITQAAKNTLLTPLKDKYFTAASFPQLQLQSSHIPPNGMLGAMWMDDINSDSMSPLQLLDTIGRMPEGNWSVLEQVTASFNGNDPLTIARNATTTTTTTTATAAFKLPSKHYLTKAFDAFFSTATLGDFQTRGLRRVEDLLLKSAVLFPAETVGALYTYYLTMPSTNSLSNSLLSKTAESRLTDILNVASSAYLASKIEEIRIKNAAGAARTTALGTFITAVDTALTPALPTGTTAPAAATITAGKTMVAKALQRFRIADALVNSADPYITTAMGTSLETDWTTAIFSAAMKSGIDSELSTDALKASYWEKMMIARRAI